MAKDAKRVIAVTCGAHGMVHLDELLPFQGDLKTLDRVGYQKLYDSLAREGICFPMFYWEHGGKKYTLDGHQRVFVLRKMIEEGWVLKDMKVPVDPVYAEDELSAKRKILLASSQYGRIGQQELYTYIQTSGLPYDTVRDMIDLPQIDMQAFEFGFMRDVMADHVKPGLGTEALPGDAQQQKKGDAYWFYVEYYGEPERYAELLKMLGGAMVTAHEVNKEFFMRMVRIHVKREGAPKGKDNGSERKAKRARAATT